MLEISRVTVDNKKANSCDPYCRPDSSCSPVVGECNPTSDCSPCAPRRIESYHFDSNSNCDPYKPPCHPQIGNPPCRPNDGGFNPIN